MLLTEIHSHPDLTLPASSPLSSKLSPYADKRVIAVFFMGMLSGLPWVMIGSMLTLWLKEAGVSRTDIGYAGFIYTVFAVNFLWAPMIDRYAPAFNLTLSRLGRRKSWVAICQLLIASACFMMVLFSAENNATHVVLVALIIAIAAATQDIAIDAFRVDQFDSTEPERISAGAAAATAGWWSAYSGIGFIPLALSDLDVSWNQIYIGMGFITLALSGIAMSIPARKRTGVSEAYRADFQSAVHQVRQTRLSFRLILFSSILLLFAFIFWVATGSFGLADAINTSPFYLPSVVFIVFAWAAVLIVTQNHVFNGLSDRSEKTSGVDLTFAYLLSTLIAPLREFFNRNGVRFAAYLLLFVFLFKLGEAFLGRMSIVFYSELGFSNTEIAGYSKMITWVVTILAAIPCGILNAQFGIVKGLFISGVLMAASNLMFSVMAYVGPDINWFVATVIVDGFTAAWATVAFVSFVSALCNQRFSATQYALLVSLSNLGRTNIAAFSGQMVDGLGGDWSLFFIITALMVIPGLCLLLVLRKYLKKTHHDITA